jgi:pseudouridine synthase
VPLLHGSPGQNRKPVEKQKRVVKQPAWHARRAGFFCSKACLGPGNIWEQTQGNHSLVCPSRFRAGGFEPELPPRNPPIRFRKNAPTAWLELILVEGRNRQVRRMTAAVGTRLCDWCRAAIGNLQLGEIQSGQWRELERARSCKSFWFE